MRWSDAESMYAATLSWIVATLLMRVPVADVQNMLHQLEESCKSAVQRNPMAHPYLLLARTHLYHYQSPAPWRFLRDAQEAMRLCQQAGDARLLGSLVTFAAAPAWFELGDAKRAVELVSAT